MATLCVGEAIVNLVCERPVDDLARADGFRPHFGGAVANVAVAAAEHGAPVALAGATGDDVTMAARERALELGRAVLFDPNLRLHRWDGVDAAVRRANACVPGALLVRANSAEAELMTAEPDPDRAAAALVGAGARLAIVTSGAQGAVLRGEVSADVASSRAARVVCTMGAGDVFTGVLLARLAQAGFDPSAGAQALEEATSEAARATGRWGAIE